MAGCRSLTPQEERRLLRVVRSLSARNRCLISLQMFTGFRISEGLSLTVGDVLRNGKVVSKIGIRPRNLKGGYGSTRWVPVSGELRRALEVYLNTLRKRWELTPEMPLFVSRQGCAGGAPKGLTRESARLICHKAFQQAGIENDGDLGTHVFRKTWARHVYSNSGHDIILLAAALNHSKITTTQKYLVPDQDKLMAAMGSVDFTRKPRTKLKLLPFKNPEQGPGTQLEFA